MIYIINLSLEHLNFKYQLNYVQLPSVFPWLSFEPTFKKNKEFFRKCFRMSDGHSVTLKNYIMAIKNFSLGQFCKNFIEFENLIQKYAILFFFTPLIAAMAGNVGVQSSAIVVQGIANDDVKGSIGQRVFKEMLLALLNGTILAVILLLFTWFWKGDLRTSIAIAISLVTVTVAAGVIGTFTPLFLHKRGIDPAIATGPFITTSNDIFGILIYFSIAKAILGF